MDKRKVLVINNEADRSNMSVAGPEDFPDYRQDRFSDVEWLAEVMRGAGNFEVVIAFHDDVDMDFIRALDPCLIIGSGRGSVWYFDQIKDEFHSMIEVLHKSGIPYLGICGGHQLLGVAFDAKLDHMSDCAETVIQEIGFTRIHVKNETDPLFAGIDTDFICMESHHDELKELPKDFELLASTDLCTIQAMRHTKLPLYGVQFHPEIHNEAHAAGKRIIQNFVDLYCN